MQPEVLPVTGPPTDMATPLTSTKSPIEAVKESRPNMSTRTMEAKEMTAAKDIPKKAEATITFWSQDKMSNSFPRLPDVAQKTQKM